MAGISGKSIMDALKTLGGSIQLLLGIIVMSVIGILIAGSVINVGTSGDIPIDGNSTLALENISNAGMGFVTEYFNANTVIVGLFILVIVL